MEVLKACLDWRVLVALALVGLGIWLLAPGAVAAVLPALVLAACPISMVLMMRMNGSRASMGEGMSHQDRTLRRFQRHVSRGPTEEPVPPPARRLQACSIQWRWTDRRRNPTTSAHLSVG
jgi:choline-glycine betaine transporter